MLGKYAPRLARTVLDVSDELTAVAEVVQEVCW